MPEAAARERRRRWEEGVANALRLHEAGVRFAFTGRGQTNPAEFWENLRRVVRAGLPREAALQGLTLAPARILGVERQMGTVEAGKLANLVVMTADFTDPKSKARYLFIDGKKLDLERETPMEPAPPGAPTP